MNDPILIDYLLAAGLVLLAGFSLRVGDLFTGVVTFIIFGLIMSVAWVRLQAPDLALAEAAIGSGITGALFLGAIRRLEESTPGSTTRPEYYSPVQRELYVVGVAGMALALYLLESALVPPLLEGPAGLAEPVSEAVDTAGARNPVTAIILNMRGYDTMLELVVLLLAWSGVCVLQGDLGRTNILPATGELAVLGAFVRFLRHPGILMAGYLVWVGGDEPGGAFQAGAMLGGVGALGLMAGGPTRPLYRGPGVRPVLIAGVAAFLLAGLSSIVTGGMFLEYRGEHAKALLLVIEIFSTLSIGLVLTLLFAACTFAPDPGRGAPAPGGHP
ncbi:MAG: hydrogenase subunit MbhD domain-containing protein [Thermodesulfobacteriota bacterium]